MINISSNIGDLGDQLMRAVAEEAEENLAEELAKSARENGLTSADEIELTITGEGSGFKIDRAKVYRRANEILRGGGLTQPR